MLARKGEQPSDYGRQLWTTTKCVESVKGDQVLPLPLLKGDCPNSPKEFFLLINYLQTDLG